MLHAYLLHDLVLAVAEPVQVAVYPRQADILIEMVLQILRCRRLARRAGQPGLDQLTEYRIPDPVEPRAVKNAVEYQVRPVDRDVRYAGQNPLRAPQFCLASATLLAEQVQAGMPPPLLPVDPLAGLGCQR